MDLRLGSVLLALALPGLLLAQEPLQRLKVDDAVQMALQASDLVQATHAQGDAAQSTANSVRGRLLPSAAVTDEALHYDKPFGVAFKVPTPPGVNLPPSPPFVVRDQNINTFAVAASQPLLGLLHLTQDLAAALDAASSAKDQSRVVESAVREAVRTGYLRLFQARAQESIAKASEEQLAEQMAVAKSKFEAGVLTRADLLRLKVAEANAHQQQISANVQGQISRANLLVAIGRPPEDPQIEFVEPTELENAALPNLEAARAEATAISRRPELLKAEDDARAASHQKLSRLFSMLPEINAEAGYTWLAGQPFAPLHASFVGLKAEWPFWEWGADFYNQRAAAHRAEAARFMAEDQRRQVSLDADTKLELAQASATAVEVAQTAIDSAEEAYRVTDALVKAGSATTTDLLDAQSALTTAKLNLVRARYEQAIALVALDRALGN